MLKYILHRLLFAVFTVFLVATLTFSIMFIVPGGPFLAEKAPSQATLDALNKKYGLDQPMIVQYKNYMLNLVKGDLGVSLKQRGRTVNDIIFTGFPQSAKIGGLAIFFAVLIGVPLGCLAAYNRGKFADNAIMVFATLGISVPSFVIATTLLVIFGAELKWFPTQGLSSAKHFVLPVAALTFYPCAYICRLMRSSMLDVLGQDYMRTAKAKGLSQFKAIFKHALRNAILPVVTYLGPAIAFTLSGSLVIEKVFTIPGLGSTYVGSAVSRDYPLIMGTTVFLAALVIFMNVIVDILYKVIDPRIKYK